MLPGDLAFEDASNLGDLSQQDWQSLLDYASSRLRAAGQKLVQEHNNLSATRIERYVGWVGREILLGMLLHSAAIIHYPNAISTPPCLRRLIAIFFTPAEDPLAPRMYDVACSGGQQERDAAVGYYREDWWNHLERTPRPLGMKDMLELYRSQAHTLLRLVPEAPPLNLVISNLGWEVLLEVRAIASDAAQVVQQELDCNYETMRKITEFLQTCGYTRAGPEPSPDMIRVFGLGKEEWAHFRLYVSHRLVKALEWARNRRFSEGDTHKYYEGIVVEFGMAKLSIALLSFVDCQPPSTVIQRCQRLLSEGLLAPHSLAFGGALDSFPEYHENEEFAAPAWLEGEQHEEEASWHQYWMAWHIPRCEQPYKLKPVADNDMAAWRDKRDKMKRWLAGMNDLSSTFKNEWKDLTKAHKAGILVLQRLKDMTQRDNREMEADLAIYA